LGPCKGDGVQIDGKAARVTVRDSYVHDTGGNGVSTYQVDGITITGSWFARNSSGGFFLESTGIRFEKSSVLDVQGPIPRGQLAQLDKSNGGNVIRCNIMENHLGASKPEDGINLYQSAGTAAAPIIVEGNRIKGGGPSMSGGGILLGDGGAASAYQVSRFNILVDPGQYGTAVAGGSHMTIQGNLVFAKKQAFTNTGIYVWDQYKSSCTDITVKDNQVDWTNRDGVNNPWWDGGNCTSLVESSNVWKAALGEAIIDSVPDVCK
ncbi:MAG: right-handed parallel beta-helix repeat-containing protein, partial [Polyangiales bacterium]